jgi:hypothetical protein
MAAAIAQVGAVGEFDLVSVTPDNSYPAGGYSLAGFTNPKNICLVVGVTPAANLAHWVYNPATQKLMAFGTAVSASGETQIAGAVDLSGQVVLLLLA